MLQFSWKMFYGQLWLGFMIMKAEASREEIQFLTGNLSFGFFYAVRDFATVALILKWTQRSTFWEQASPENLMSTYGREC